MFPETTRFLSADKFAASSWAPGVEHLIVGLLFIGDGYLLLN
jgi:hypothetical protein